MGFEQAQIPVQKTEEFEQLRSAIERSLSSAAVERFYSQLQSRSMQVRNFEGIAASGIFEVADATLARSGRTAKELYESLTVSDQAMIREFYLEKIEQVDAKIRQKYKKVYRYY